MTPRFSASVTVWVMPVSRLVRRNRRPGQRVVPNGTDQLDVMAVERFNVFSQFGEDSVLAAIFERLGTVNGLLLELGAWDGIHLSNCRALIERGWRGVHVEADPDKADVLQRNVAQFGGHAICALVGPAGTSLRQVLSDAQAPARFDLVSIDIDSDDLAVLVDFCSERRADVVCIEFNPSVPSDIRFVNTPGHCWGNSALAIYEVAVAHGYSLVAHTLCNLVFVSDDVNGGRIATMSLTQKTAIGHVRLWWGYDGTLFSATVESAALQPMVTPTEVIHPAWGQPGFPQPVPPEQRVWPKG